MLKRCPELVDDTGHILFNDDGKVKAIHYCAMNADLKGLKMVVRYGADVSELTPGSKRSVLNLIMHSETSYQKQLECIEFILEQHISNIDHVDENGCTALILAARRLHLPLVSLLLKHGADPSCSCPVTNTTALWYLTRTNPTNKATSEILPLLYANAPASSMIAANDEQDEQDGRILPSLPFTPQMIALYKGDMPSVYAFIEAGWFINYARFNEAMFETYLQRWPKMQIECLEKDHLEQPPTLKWWAKRATRRNLPPHPHKVMDQLNLPDVMKKYVLQVDDLSPEETKRLESFQYYDASEMCSASDDDEVIYPSSDSTRYSIDSTDDFEECFTSFSLF